MSSGRGLIEIERGLGPIPPILAGHSTEATQRRVEKFFLSVAAVFESWVQRRRSPHTQRAYRQDVMQLVSHLGLLWPQDAAKLFAVSVVEVRVWRDKLNALGMAPKTVNRRVSSVSSFYRYLQAVAAELRLPIIVPNPAHAQFIGRASQDAVNETRSLTATQARLLMGMPQGEDAVSTRDRAILRFLIYSGARIGTACRLRAQDFEVNGEDATIRVAEKGDKRRTIGLHFAAANAISDFMQVAGIEAGPLFRPRRGPTSGMLRVRPMSEAAMYSLIMQYLRRLPGSMRTDVAGVRHCIYSPHSLRATTATLLLDAGVDICKVQVLLGHRHVTTTQVYDKRRRTTRESASHEVPV